MPVVFPGETSGYRAARNALLEQELALRAQVESVAALRRSLPDGGAVPDDYAFTSVTGDTERMSSLFTMPGNTLCLYSLMFRPDADAPCPMCVSMLDGLAGQARHIGQNVDFAVVAAATPQQLSDLSNSRGWSDLKLLSAAGTTYQQDYHGEAEDGSQLPMMNVFRKSPDGIRHFWGSEGFFADVEGHPRHVDQMWPLWNLLDLTPQGRGEDWFPALTYG